MPRHRSLPDRRLEPPTQLPRDRHSEARMLTVRLADGDAARARVDLLAVALTRTALERGALRPLERATGRRIRTELERRRFKAAEGAALLVAGGGRLGAPHLLV